MPTLSLQDILESKQSGYSPWAGTILMTSMFGRNLIHLHRPTVDDREDDLNGSFWQRHRIIDGILLGINLKLPGYLRLPAGLPNPSVIFFNMSIHTAAICLHQAAIFKADRNNMPRSISTESKTRCMSAAVEVAGIMRLISHLELGAVGLYDRSILLGANITVRCTRFYLSAYTLHRECLCNTSESNPTTSKLPLRCISCYLPCTP